MKTTDQFAVWYADGYKTECKIVPAAYGSAVKIGEKDGTGFTAVFRGDLEACKAYFKGKTGKEFE